ncbi:FumA C-terminus/TtdB family hydratase beta subunit [Oceanotoga sp. DSM 15011]|uniref:FumA C-terminus/TtdB family hydratase beta subunit n=1 Tax=Oceanotoga sp. DSM 15011 TaxID=2984951 RepID=UPI0021F4B1E8|nr:FumA C-terminus/TtdB family hydratase beta subunit [Oceanotoga sp. DSM 15011]UYO99146.1 FumA C-terminus/TtdB family hydratase beta subunit [Oceanotoga sp. DSM 15011]
MFELRFDEYKAGDFISFSGEFIIMRDAAHKRIFELFQKGECLPIDFKNKIIFYAGPAKKPYFQSIGAIGPTTSNRMDPFLKFMYDLGIYATVGKGKRSSFVCNLNIDYSKFYLIAPSGVAAFLSKKIISHEVLAFEDLGTESIQRILVKDFPLIMGIDSKGNTIY